MSRTEDKMIEELRNGRVAIAEPEEDDELEKFFMQKKAEKAASKPAVAPTKEVERIDLLFPKAKKIEPPKVEEIKPATIPSVSLETQQELQQQVEEEVEEEIEEEEIVQSRLLSGTQPTYVEEQETQVDENEQVDNAILAIQKQKVKKAKFRVKFISIAICIAIGLFTGLAIYNSVKINKLTSEIATSSQQLKVNYAKYFYKVSQLDDLIEDGKNAPVDNFEIPAERYLDSYPEEVVDVVEIQKESNWFDRMISTIRGWFGKS